MQKSAFLRSSEGVFTLAPKLTVIGRESCDFVIQNLTVDSQQAVIEFIETEDCYVLKDLNSSHGTFVNDCRIQNASVRLANGDILRFGFSTGQYEFNVSEESIENTQEMIQTSTSVKTGYFPPTSNAPINSISLPSISHPLQHRHTAPIPQTAWSQLPPAGNSSKLIRPASSASNYGKRQLTPSAPIPLNLSQPGSRKGSITGSSRSVILEQKQTVDQTLENRLKRIEVDLEKMKPPFIKESTGVNFGEWTDRQTYSINQDNSNQTFILEEQEQPPITIENDNQETIKKIEELTNEIGRKNKEITQLQSIIDRVTRNTNENNSNNNNGIQKKELDKIKRDLQVCQGLVTSLQKDITQKDEIVSKLRCDIEQLNHELAEKDITISSVMTKLSKLKDVEDYENEKRDVERENISLKEKLSASEVNIQELIEKFECMRRKYEEAEMKIKKDSEEIENLTKEVTELKEKNIELTKSESVLKVDLQKSQKKYDRLHNRLLQVVISIPGFQSNTGCQTLDDDVMIEEIKQLVDDKVEHDLRMCEKQKIIENLQKQVNDVCDDFGKFNEELKKILTGNAAEPQSSNQIQIKRDTLMSFVLTSQSPEVNCQLEALRNVIVQHLECEITRQANLESCIAELDPDLKDLNINECFKKLLDDCKAAVANRDECERTLSERLSRHQSELEELQKKKEDELVAKIEEVILQERAEAEMKLLEQRLNIETSLKEEYDAKINELDKSLDYVNNRLQTTMKENMDLKKKLEDQKIMKNGIKTLEENLERVNKEKAELEISVCSQIETAREQWQEELIGYKEETKQHAITIEQLNEKLKKSEEDNREFIKEIEILQQKLSKKVIKKKSSEEQQASERVGIDKDMTFQIANLERCIAALRHENASLKTQLIQKEEIVVGLNKDLQGAEARLSDLKGELTEQQKTELDSVKLELQKLDKEYNETRSQMAKLTGIIDGLNQEVEDKKMEIKIIQSQLEETKIIVKEKETKVQDLEMILETDRENFLQQMNKVEQEGRLTTELASIGTQCRGDRHIQIIEAQKIALSDMRQRVKTLEVVGVGTRDEDSLRQNIQLKKELAELRAKQALQESAPAGMNSLMDLVDQQKANGGGTKRYQKNGKLLALTNGADDTKQNQPQDEAEKMRVAKETHQLTKSNQKLEFDVNFLKNNLADANKNLELSESTYINLVRKLMEALEVEKVKGLRSFDNLPIEAKTQLRADRDDTSTLFVQKIRILRERIMRKEELLQGYEADLVKLRQAENLATKTQQQLDCIIDQMRNKGEEVDLLRETLNRTKDLLNQEKRVNTAIKSKNKYVPCEDMPNTCAEPSSGTSKIPKYHCMDPGVDREKMKEKQKSEKMKRKNYEIKTLKDELYKKEKELGQATNRLHTLETTMGIKSEEPVS